MSFAWQGYLDLAEYMNTTVSGFPCEEACYRTIASRAYYAVFCAARNYIRAADGVCLSRHQDVQDHLKRVRSKRDRCKIGNQLKRLHQIRKKADYDDDLYELPTNMAAQALSQAKRISEGILALST